MEDQTLTDLIDSYKAAQTRDEKLPIMQKAFEVSTQEAIASFTEKFPSVLDEIEAARQAYLQKLIAYYNLKKGVSEQVKQTARDMGINPDRRECNPHFKKPDLYGELSVKKYIVIKSDVDLALNEGRMR